MGSANIAFNRVDGDDPLRLSGVTIYPMADYGAAGEELADGCTWKSSGCYAVDGLLYWVVARHKYGETSGDAHRRQTAANASIILSTMGLLPSAQALGSLEEDLDPPVLATRVLFAAGLPQV